MLEDEFLPGGTNTLLVALASVLFILLLLQTIGLVWFVRKFNRSRRKAIKRDLNPLYGVDGNGEDNQRASADQNYDYMGS